MRRTLAAVALGVAVIVAPLTSASAAPECDIFQNCICTTANGVLKKATGYDWLHCV